MKTRSAIIISFLIFLTSCKQGFEPIDYGKEACKHCQMTIVDRRYAAEIVDVKGKVYKFDDAGCMKKFINEHNMPIGDKLLFVADYKNAGGSFLDAKTALYLHNDFFKTPMNGNCGAFASAAEAKQLQDSLKTAITSWNDIK